MSEGTYVVNGARTAMGEYVGALKEFSANELGAIACRGALKRAAVAPEEIEHVVMGQDQREWRRDCPRPPSGGHGYTASPHSLLELRRSNGRYGLATACIGGRQGTR